MAASHVTTKHCAASFVPYWSCPELRIYSCTLRVEPSSRRCDTLCCETVLDWRRRIQASGRLTPASAPLASSSVNSLTRLVPFCDQPGSDNMMSRATYICVDSSCADGFQPRFVQIALGHFVVDLQTSHKFQLCLDNIVSQLRIQRQSS